MKSALFLALAMAVSAHADILAPGRYAITTERIDEGGDRSPYRGFILTIEKGGKVALDVSTSSVGWGKHETNTSSARIIEGKKNSDFALVAEYTEKFFGNSGDKKKHEFQYSLNLSFALEVSSGGGAEVCIDNSYGLQKPAAAERANHPVFLRARIGRLPTAQQE